MSVTCLNYKTYINGTLQGYADLFVEKWGVEIYGCSLHMKDGGRWINLPSREYKNQEGETKWSSIVRFANKDHAPVFSKMAIDAIDKWCAEHAAKVDEANVGEVVDDLPF